MRNGLALVVSVAGAALVAMDGTVLVVAQPGLADDLDAGLAQVQWTSTGYLVAVAALLVVAGPLGDRHGHRGLLVAGVVGFGATSAGIAFAPGIAWVIGLRTAQGVFGAMLQPATLALLRLAYPADRWGRAIAVRTSVIGLASAAGPVLGGAIVTHAGWRAVFVLNVPVCLAIVGCAAGVRMRRTQRGAHRLDLAGAGLLAAALAVTVVTLVGVRDGGRVSASTWLGVPVVLVLVVLLVAHERRTREPIVPGVVVRATAVTASMSMLQLTTAGLFGALSPVSSWWRPASSVSPARMPAGSGRVSPARRSVPGSPR